MLQAAITVGETALIAAIVAGVVGAMTVAAQLWLGRGANASANRASQAAAESAEAAKEGVLVSAKSAADSARRAEEDARSKLYQEAAAQLGHEKAPVRLAGVYAMARLADDWPEQRQTCVDVLCAYLRMAYVAPSNAADNDPERQVRLTIQNILRDHLQQDARMSWSDVFFDLSGASLDSFQMTNAIFNVGPRFRFARFTRYCDMNYATFRQGGDFSGSHLADGCVFQLGAIRVEGGDLKFLSAQIESGSSLSVSPVLVAELAATTLSFIDVSGSLSLHVDNQDEERGKVYARAIRVRNGGSLKIWGLEALFAGTTMSAPHIDATDCTVEAGAKVSISGELLSNGFVSWKPRGVGPTASIDLSPRSSPHRIEFAFPDSPQAPENGPLS